MDPCIKWSHDGLLLSTFSFSILTIRLNKCIEANIKLREILWYTYYVAVYRYIVDMINKWQVINADFISFIDFLF
jgi:hypothetical protein